jgi:hypothetical protein
MLILWDASSCSHHHLGTRLLKERICLILLKWVTPWLITISAIVTLHRSSHYHVHTSHHSLIVMWSSWHWHHVLGILLLKLITHLHLVLILGWIIRVLLGHHHGNWSMHHLLRLLKTLNGPILVVNHDRWASNFSFLRKARVSPVWFLTTHLITMMMMRNGSSNSHTVFLACNAKTIWHICIKGLISSKDLLLSLKTNLFNHLIRLMTYWFRKNSTRWMLLLLFY